MELNPQGGTRGYVFSIYTANSIRTQTAADATLDPTCNHFNIHPFTTPSLDTADWWNMVVVVVVGGCWCSTDDV